MFKSLLAGLALFLAAGLASAVDVNRATQAELEALKGVGPGIATKILDERKKGSFKDWDDFIDRVKGVGENNAAKFSAEGLTVGNATYKGAAPAAAKASDKAADKADKKPAVAKEAKEAKEPAMAAKTKDEKPTKAANEDKPAKGDKAAAKDKADDDKATAKAKKAMEDKKVEDKPKKT
jgi:competence protein ComEA